MRLGVCRCMLSGACLASQVCIGGPQEFTLHTRDSFGNARAAGGEEVTVEVTGPPGTQIQRAAVTDRGNGCYGVSFQPDREGRWLLMPRSDSCSPEWVLHHKIYLYVEADLCVNPET